MSVRSWGIDRLDQLSLPLDGVFSPSGLDGYNTHVYVLDTGLRSSHVDFRGRVGEGVSIVGGDTGDRHGHGTHAAGSAVGGLHGVATRAIIHPVKVCITCANSTVQTAPLYSLDSIYHSVNGEGLCARREVGVKWTNVILKCVIKHVIET